MPIRKIVAKSAMSLQPAKTVTNFADKHVQQAAQDLLDTLAAEQKRLDAIYPNQGAGVGLASNQIAYPEPDYPKNFMPPNMYVISIRPQRAQAEQCDEVKPMVYINASYEAFLQSDKLKRYQEGCLSIAGIQGLSVPRHAAIKITAHDVDGQEIKCIAKGFVARVHQHEQDHCCGQEYLNHMDFSSDTLDEINFWIANHRNQPTPQKDDVIVKNLTCTGAAVDFDALQAWVDAAKDNLESESKNAFKF